MVYLLPVDFDLSAHLVAYPPKEVPAFHPDELVRLLNLITELPANNRKLAKKVRQHGGFVPISSQLAQGMVRLYHLYLAYAVRTGILLTDGRWWPQTPGAEGKCQGYKFAAAYGGEQQGGLTPRMQLVSLTDPNVIQKAKRQAHTRSLLTAEEKRWRRVQEQRHAHWLQWIDHTTLLRIDQVAALTYIEGRFADAQREPEASRRKRQSWKQKSFVRKLREEAGTAVAQQPEYRSPAEQYNQRLRSIMRLTSRELRPLIDTTAGRLHTTLTNMSSKLRDFVYLEGYSSPLVSLDLSNSQPYLANILLNPDRWENITRGKKIWHGCVLDKTKVNKKHKEREEVTNIMLVNCLKLVGAEDVVLYGALTSGGNFYERLAGEFRRVGESEYASRSALKELVFQVLFTKNGHHSSCKRAFGALFPTVDATFRLVKKGDHCRLPRLLQRLEAYLFLQVIGKRLARELPGVPVFTIHDSVIVPQNYADQVEAIMRAELERAVGLPPALKRELWGQGITATPATA